MLRALSPAGFFTIVMIYLLTLFGLSIMASTVDTEINIVNDQFLFIQALGVLIIFIFIPCILVLLFSPEKLKYFLIHKRPPLGFIFISSILIVVALPLIGYLEEINKAIALPHSLAGLENWMKASEAKAQAIEDTLMNQVGMLSLVKNLFVVAFMAALSEEIFFRGILQQSLLKLTKNAHVAIWITAILFSAFHLQFYGFIPRVLLGAILGYIYFWSGSLWTSITVHFLNNALVLVMAYLLNTGRLPKTIGNIGLSDEKVPLSWAIPAALLTAACLYLLYKMKKNIDSKRSGLS
jgi:membrane protease YdiL (CAAX protease family)